MAGRLVHCADLRAAEALNALELEGVRRAIRVGFRSTDTVARLLATVEALAAALADADGLVDDMEGAR